MATFQPQPTRPSPQPTSGFGFWLRQNIFNSPLNSIISLLMIALIAWSLFNLVTWLIAESDWQIVWNNQRLLAVYQYPTDLIWRPMACVILLMSLFGLNAGVSNEGIGFIIRRAFYWILGLIAIVAIIALVYWESVRLYWVLAVIIPIVMYFIGGAIPQIGRFLSWGWALLWFVCTFLLVGFGGGHGDEGMMRFVDPHLWGGILITFFLSITGIVLCFPIGIGLALGRESKLPIIRGFCTAYIEILRGSPLVSWLFLASVMLPLALGGITPAAIIRAQVAIILFAAAYMAENVRGGLQALPKGQGEAAHALGLSPWDTTSIIILPQALRAVIPAIVGLFIGLFKDTSLILIVGLVDVFAMLSLQIANQVEATQVPGGILKELFIYGSIFYWFFCYRMSIASRQLEKQLGLGTR